MSVRIVSLLMALLLLVGCVGSNPQQQMQAAQIDRLTQRIAELEAQQQVISSQASRGVPVVPTGITAVPAQRRSGVYDDAPIHAAAGNHVPAQSAMTGLEQGIALYRAGDIDNAISFFQQYVSQGSQVDPAELNLARYWLGDAYYTQQRYDEASRFLGLYLRAEPNGEKAATALSKLVYSLRALGRTQDAEILNQYGVQALMGN